MQLQIFHSNNITDLIKLAIIILFSSLYHTFSTSRFGKMAQTISYFDECFKNLYITFAT